MTLKQFYLFNVLTIYSCIIITRQTLALVFIDWQGLKFATASTETYDIWYESSYYI